MNEEYEFTQDWFHWAPEVWNTIIPLLPTRSRFLDLGSFEGRSAVWIVENMMEGGGQLFCVDTWEGGEEHIRLDLSMTEVLFDRNISKLQRKHPDREVVKIKNTTYEALTGLTPLREKCSFDFIYIDASHVAKDVLSDAVLAWPLLKKDGIMVFDDYLWGDPRDLLHRPKIAIDAFVNIFAEEIIPVHSHIQHIIRKRNEAAK